MGFGIDERMLSHDRALITRNNDISDLDMADRMKYKPGMMHYIENQERLMLSVKPFKDNNGITKYFKEIIVDGMIQDNLDKVSQYNNAIMEIQKNDKALSEKADEMNIKMDDINESFKKYNSKATAYKTFEFISDLDIEDTIDLEMKNIHIKGRTLKNLIKDGKSIVIDTSISDPRGYHLASQDLIQLLAPNTTYTISFQVDNDNKENEYSFSNIVLGESKSDNWCNSTDTWSYRIENEVTKFKNGRYIKTFTVPEDFKPTLGMKIDFVFDSKIKGKTNIKNLILLEDEKNNVWKYENTLQAGLNSVADNKKIAFSSAGINIFKMKKSNWLSDDCTLNIIDDSSFTLSNNKSGTWKNATWELLVEPNTDYVISCIATSIVKNVEDYGDAKWIAIRDCDGNLLIDMPSCNGVFNSGNNETIRISFFSSIMNGSINTVSIKDLIICKKEYYKNAFVPYVEPSYKEIQLDIESGLKSINDVYDEILNGKLIKRINSIVLNGDEDWQIHNYHTDNSILVFTDAIDKDCIDGKSEVIAEKFVTLSRDHIEDYILGYDNKPILEIEGIWKGTTSGTGLFILINKDKLKSIDGSGIKEYFKSNPLICFYQLKEPVVSDISFNIDMNAINGTTVIKNKNNIVSNIKINVPMNIGKITLDNQMKINTILETLNKIVTPNLMESALTGVLLKKEIAKNFSSKI